MAVLNYQSIPNHPERISNLEPAGHKDYSPFEKNNPEIALNILYIPYNTFEIRSCYI